MKLFVLIATLLSSMSALASPINVICENTSKSANDSYGDIFNSEMITAQIDNKKVIIQNSANNNVAKAIYSGISKRGDYMYKTEDFQQEVNQSDIGFVFVSPAIFDDNKGSLAISTRQSSDSGNKSSWITSSYNCIAQ